MDTTAVRFGMVSYLQQKLILGDSLHWLDQIGRDGVGQAVPLLNFLPLNKQTEKDSDVTTQRRVISFALMTGDVTHIEVVASVL